MAKFDVYSSVDNIIQSGKHIIIPTEIEIEPSDGTYVKICICSMAAFGVYKGFFANKNLADPWDDHDD